MRPAFGWHQLCSRSHTHGGDLLRQRLPNILPEYVHMECGEMTTLVGTACIGRQSVATTLRRSLRGTVRCCWEVQEVRMHFLPSHRLPATAYRYRYSWAKPLLRRNLHSRQLDRAMLPHSPKKANARPPRPVSRPSCRGITNR